MKLSFPGFRSVLSSLQVLLMICAFSPILTARADEWEDDQEIPEFTSESSLFRGTNERQVTLEQVIRMLSRTHAAAELIPSRRWKNLRTFLPQSIDSFEISRQIQEDLDFFRSKKILRTYAQCHSDWRECTPPLFEDLLGLSFAHLLSRSPFDSVARVKFSELQKQHDSPTDVEKSLYFFDPVISTSVSVDVARSFARDEYSESGALLFASFVLELKDTHFRHCPATTRRTNPWSCVISATEYAEEFEYPFLGWIEADEIFGVERGGTKLTFDSLHSQIRVESHLSPPSNRFFLMQPVSTGHCPDSATQDLRKTDEPPASWQRIDPDLRDALTQENWICLF